MKKQLKVSPIIKDNLSNFIKSTNNKNARKHLIYNSLTDNSRRTSFISKTNNKIYSITLNDYWFEREIKKRIKMAKLLEEKKKKETSELREKPQINKNSLRIAERLGSNSSISVFERLSESGNNKILFNERKMNLFTKNNKTFKKFDISNNYKRNQKKSNPKFKTFKQLDKKEDMKPKIQNSKIPKVIKIDKSISNRAKIIKNDNKYISNYNSKEKSKNMFNKKDCFKTLNDDNILSCYNSTENIISNQNLINEKIKYLFNNEKLINFLNKNQSLGSLNCEEIPNKRKVCNKLRKQGKIPNQIIKTVNTLTNDLEFKERKKEYYNTEINKKISLNKLISQELKSNKVIDYRNGDGKNINIYKNNLKINNNNKNSIKNYKTKNVLIISNSFNRNINNKSKNPLNISSNQINEDIHKIRRRKMDLLKILNFSSNIGINNKN